MRGGKLLLAMAARLEERVARETGETDGGGDGDNGPLRNGDGEITVRSGQRGLNGGRRPNWALSSATNC